MGTRCKDEFGDQSLGQMIDIRLKMKKMCINSERKNVQNGLIIIKYIDDSNVEIFEEFTISNSNEN
jgi:hypothetical protein